MRPLNCVGKFVADLHTGRYPTLQEVPPWNGYQLPTPKG